MRKDFNEFRRYILFGKHGALIVVVNRYFPRVKAVPAMPAVRGLGRMAYIVDASLYQTDDASSADALPGENAGKMPVDFMQADDDGGAQATAQRTVYIRPAADKEGGFILNMDTIEPPVIEMLGETAATAFFDIKTFDGRERTQAFDIAVRIYRNAVSAVDWENPCDVHERLLPFIMWMITVRYVSYLLRYNAAGGHYLRPPIQRGPLSMSRMPLFVHHASANLHCVSVVYTFLYAKAGRT